MPTCDNSHTCREDYNCKTYPDKKDCPFKAPGYPQAASEAVAPLNDLLGAKDLAIAALDNLQNEFKKLGVTHYEDMVDGMCISITGAVVITQQAKNL